MHRTTRWLLALTLALVPITAACGDDDDDTVETDPAGQVSEDDMSEDDMSEEDDMTEDQKAAATMAQNSQPSPGPASFDIA